eukprot:11282846-Ditylum_brightwellii.AAC.2
MIRPTYLRSQRDSTLPGKNYVQVKKNAAYLRDEFLEEMVQIYTTIGNTNIATTIKNLQHCEEVQTASFLLRYAAKGEVAGSVSTLKIPDLIQPNSALYPETLFSLQFQTH